MTQDRGELAYKAVYGNQANWQTLSLEEKTQWNGIYDAHIIQL